MNLYICKHCGNVISYEKSCGVRVLCCGEVMEELVPGSVDAAQEKHVPVVTIKENSVKIVVGEIEHPMTQEHYIEFITIETKNGTQKVKLSYDDKPEANFILTSGDEFIAAYAYCNLHGFWKSK